MVTENIYRVEYWHDEDQCWYASGGDFESAMGAEEHERELWDRGLMTRQSQLRRFTIIIETDETCPEVDIRALHNGDLICEESAPLLEALQAASTAIAAEVNNER